jgi:hypothetical protein
MSASFVVVAFLAAVLLVYWRLTLLVLAACLLAFAAFGIGLVTPEQASGAPPVTVSVPVQPGAGVVGQPHN